MQRVTEPELMLKASQVNAYSEADFSSSDNQLLEDFEKFLMDSGRELGLKNLIIDLGCGPGNITELLAMKWPLAKVVGIDGSEEMLSVARRRRKDLIQKYNLKGLVYFQKNISSIYRDQTTLDESAHAVVSNSLLHHIHNPSIFWEAVKKISLPNSCQFHRDLRRPYSTKEALVLQEKYLPDAPKVLKDDYLASLHASFTVIEVRDQLLMAGLDSLKVYEVDDRYLEIKGFF
ncbi:class I SAM-dependent methyltransferase [Prochlorococcus marinus]|uniref:Methylase involved in ubiquinone/menaquinone biosynthesis n=1 Tax=Prochlorococcus marinus (strain MIT 9211) TaxID=93059 RepID=A9BA41_PROM4|nr:class I SAM-dependent methyltransferase [Prochlorococcus marinus]ABX08703.1 Methylase involved in ubiquinone/menaquinone biosynthesis [Prochlorococcus marinus str. MIT 9211]